jgi:hypothetical protein
MHVLAKLAGLQIKQFKSSAQISRITACVSNLPKFPHVLHCPAGFEEIRCSNKGNGI